MKYLNCKGPAIYVKDNSIPLCVLYATVPFNKAHDISGKTYRVYLGFAAIPRIITLI